MAAKSICDPYSPQALAQDANIAVDVAVGGGGQSVFGDDQLPDDFLGLLAHGISRWWVRLLESEGPGSAW